MDNLYEELGLKQDCSFEDIKQQYRILARVHHPDMGGDEEKFKRIKLAYEVLSDPDRRKEYDTTGNFKPALDIQLQAKETLSQIFYSILPDFDPSKQNILEIIKLEITNGIITLNNNKTQCNVYIEKLELTKSKINIRNDLPDNLFGSFVDMQIQNKRNDLNHFDKRIEIANEMLKILENYTYGFAELPEVITGGGFKYDGGG
jgi:curved DNA-binding protein CbpA